LKKIVIAALAAAAATLSGCATGPEASANGASAPQEREYTTGSNIGRRARTSQPGATK
jgi:hypothetical protein